MTSELLQHGTGHATAPAIEARLISGPLIGSQVEIETDGMTLRGTLVAVEHGGLLNNAAKVKLTLDTAAGIMFPKVRPRTMIVLLDTSSAVGHG